MGSGSIVGAALLHAAEAGDPLAERAGYVYRLLRKRESGTCHKPQSAGDFLPRTFMPDGFSDAARVRCTFKRSARDGLPGRILGDALSATSCHTSCKHLTMRFFLAGIMQGSHLASAIHNQDYRTGLTALLRAHFPDAEVYDPWADHSGSLDYDDDRGRRVFLDHNRLAGEVDVLVAYVPEASMGTAIEMWEAWRHGRAVVTISPLKHNWAVKFLSHALYADLAELEASLADGRLAERLRQFAGGRLVSGES
jgi:hypothetical protein